MLGTVVGPFARGSTVACVLNVEFGHEGVLVVRRHICQEVLHPLQQVLLARLGHGVVCGVHVRVGVRERTKIFRLCLRCRHCWRWT